MNDDEADIVFPDSVIQQIQEAAEALEKARDDHARLKADPKREAIIAAQVATDNYMKKLRASLERKITNKLSCSSCHLGFIEANMEELQILKFELNTDHVDMTVKCLRCKHEGPYRWNGRLLVNDQG